jgi:type IV pilus assembly protein PilM
MALFSSSSSCLGIDIGTSSLKLVELVNRRRRIEVATYAEADIANLLIDLSLPQQEAIRKTAEVIKQMMEKAEVSADAVVAALPSSIVFSTVITMPHLPEQEMEKAVQFAARDIVPADLKEMVLGWSRVGTEPHMATDEDKARAEKKNGKSGDGAAAPSPVFLTAAPKRIVDRYLTLIKNLNVHLLALEVETFPLVRSLLNDPAGSALIVDIGDMATTFHIIDKGTPHVSHTMEYGGHAITNAIVGALNIPVEEAEEKKRTQGLTANAPEQQKEVTESAVRKQVEKANHLLTLYQRKEGKKVARSILIGGGAGLPGLAQYWKQETGHDTVIGNPWKGLSYPQELETQLQMLGPTYGVAIGLALRGCSHT